MKKFGNFITVFILILLLTTTGHSVFGKNSRTKKEVYINFLNVVQRSEMTGFWNNYTKTFFDQKRNARTPTEKEISDFLKNSEKTLTFYTASIGEVEGVITKSPRREKLDNAVRSYINFLKEERKAMNELFNFYKSGLHKNEANFQKENELHVNYLNIVQKGKSFFDSFSEEVHKFENGEK